MKILSQKKNPLGFERVEKLTDIMLKTAPAQFESCPFAQSPIAMICFFIDTYRTICHNMFKSTHISAFPENRVNAASPILSVRKEKTS
jgi:hypothetical protein